MSIRKKIVWLPYDMDTALGINNEGELVFGYELEDTDHLEGGADVYNGQQSVIWNNIRMAFGKELAEMYRTLRSQGKLSYDAIEKAFEEHQSMWPEALFNEDSQFCYLDPLINDGTNYLEMLQGSKEEQRKWWMYNRFRYIDSKYNAGDALSDLIQVRSYAKSDITVTPYADIYPTVKFGSYLVTKRGKRNVATVLECPVDALNDTETYIYSASQLISVGDLSGLKVGFADFSMATKLQSLKLGDSSASYENQNLKTLTLGNNVLLQTIDVRNCTALGSGDMKVVDISGCTGIQKAWFNNTKISALTLPIGGVLNELVLPSTITNLTIRNQPKLTSFTLEGNDYSSISTCRIENTNYFLTNETRLMALINGLPDNSRVRFVGIDIDWLADTTAINAFYDLLSRFRGLDINGENLPNAYLEGTIHINSAKGADIAALKERYPYVNIDAAHTESYIYYYNGSTLITSEKVLDGGDGTYTGTTPTKSQDAQYTYTFAGWSKDDDNTVDSDALTNVVADRNVYACFTGTLRKYTVYFVKASADGGGTLQTISDVDYGTTITAASSYTGSTPTTSQGSAEDYPFEGWTPASATVTGNTTFTAKFGSPVEVKEITDSWDTIIANIDNGTYATKYKIGNYKPIDFGSEGIINMQIVAMDADELASGGTAPLTFVAMEALANEYPFTSSTSSSVVAVSWGVSRLRTTLQSTIFALIPEAVRNRINTVIKTSNTRVDSSLVRDGETTSDKIWILSSGEISGHRSNTEQQGPTYENVYADAESRIKYVNGTAVKYILRSRANTANRYIAITETGLTSYYNVSTTGTYKIVIGFCLGLEPETITDSWETILANENPSATYNIGDTKYVDLGTKGRHLMEIVAFDADDKADGSGKAKITWLSKYAITPFKGYGGDNSYIRGDMIASYLPDNYEVIENNLPNILMSGIVPVTKSTKRDGVSSESTMTVWAPSFREIRGIEYPDYWETSGPIYSERFPNASSRIKGRKGSTYLSKWTARTNANGIIDTKGNTANGAQSDNVYLVFGFCTD